MKGERPATYLHAKSAVRLAAAAAVAASASAAAALDSVVETCAAVEGMTLGAWAKDKMLSASQLRALRAIPGNDACADCGAAQPQWASIGHGTLMCLECSGEHRSLGPDVSRPAGTGSGHGHGQGHEAQMCTHVLC